MELTNIAQAELDSLATATNSPAAFLQSFAWGEFQKNFKHRVWRFGVFENEKIIAAASVLENNLPLSQSFLYCPRGPIMDPSLTVAQKNNALSLILSKVRDLTIATDNKEEMFLRFEPTWDLTDFTEKIWPTLAIQPASTALLDLEKNLDEIFNNFKAKTRYNIRLAEKKGVVVERLPATDFASVWPIFQKTAAKNNFGLHEQKYYQTMLKEFSPAELWVAKTPTNEIAAANIMIFFGHQATYLHGASDNDLRSFMAPHLLHWEAIKMAKNRGLNIYDFYGVKNDSKTTNSWAGFSRFKESFGAEIINLSGTLDFVYNKPRYRLYCLLRFFLRKINRLIR